MNTKIKYLYRDGSNYKTLNSVIVAGILTEAEKEEIYASRNDGLWFIPRQIGLPEVRFDDFPTEDDHCWFELEKGNITETDESPDVEITAKELLERFRQASGHWDDVLYAV